MTLKKISISTSAVDKAIADGYKVLANVISKSKGPWKKGKISPLHSLIEANRKKELTPSQQEIKEKKMESGMNEAQAQNYALHCKKGKIESLPKVKKDKVTPKKDSSPDFSNIYKQFNASVRRDKKKFKPYVANTTTIVLRQPGGTNPLEAGRKPGSNYTGD